MSAGQLRPPSQGTTHRSPDQHSPGETCVGRAYATASAWQRAVNRQPGFRSDNSESRKPLSEIVLIFEILENFENSTKNVNFLEPLNPIELFPVIIISLFY